MNYIVFDLEWNQSSEKQHKGFHYEIIEIGAVKLDENLNILSEFQSVIRPSIYKEMNRYVQELTNISQEEIDAAPDFDRVISQFGAWCGEDVVFCSFGDQDLYYLQYHMDYFQIDCKKHGFDFQYPLRYMDVQRLYGLCMEQNGRKRYSLGDTVKELGIAGDDGYHRALADARYTAKVFQKLYALSGEVICNYLDVDTYRIPVSKKAERVIHLKDSTVFLTHGYRNKETVMENRKLLHVTCPFCSTSTTATSTCKHVLEWFSDNGKYLMVGFCDIHGYIEGNIQIKFHPYLEKFYGIQRLFGVDEEEYQRLVQKKKAIIERRRQMRQRLSE